MFHEFDRPLIFGNLNVINFENQLIEDYYETYVTRELTASPNLVSIRPGHMQLTRTPLGPNSRAINLVNPRRAVLLRAYAPRTSF